MASELQAIAKTGLTLYAQILNPLNGQIYNTAAAAFQAYATANIADYDFALTEQGTASGIYLGNFPTLSKGRYVYRVLKRVGGSPAESDPIVYLGEVEWDGSAATHRLVSSFSDNSLTDSAIAVPAEAAGVPSRILAMLRRSFEWRHNKKTRDRTTGTLALRNAADNGTLETKTQSTSGQVDTETKGA